MASLTSRCSCAAEWQASKTDVIAASGTASSVTGAAEVTKRAAAVSSGGGLHSCPFIENTAQRSSRQLKGAGQTGDFVELAFAR
jgi:hypothetical protein